MRGRSQAVGQMRNIFSHHLTMKKHFQVDASYGFKMHATDQTKTIIEAGKKAAKLPEIEMPDFLKKYTWFQTSQNTAGNIKIRKTKYGDLSMQSRWK